MIRVLRRQVGWDLALVGLVTLVLVALTLGWPRALDRLVREDLMAQVAALPVTQRDLGLTVPHRLVDLASLDAAGSRAVLAGADAWTDEQIAGAGPQLSAVLGPPEHEITRTPYFVDLSPSAPGVSYMKVTLSAGPRRDDLRLVAGAWPEAPDVSPWLTAAAGYIPPPIELEVVVSSDTARWMGWQVGEVRGSRDPSYPVALRLTGLVEAVDPGSGVWQHLSGVLEPAIDRDDNAGWTVHGVAYVDPDATAVLMVPRGAQLDAWYPLDVSAVGAADRDALGAELAGVRASTGLRTGVSAVLATTEGRERTATTVLQVLVTGLVGVAAGALWLVAT
ncbi:MAG TPA: hypothetical protein PKB06_11685, partial [Actinotalea sp.]|nr:hypothetical protein [Actinotalea sp.]